MLWFKYYKKPTGKDVNKFAFDGKCKNREFALKIIDETHEQWEAMMKHQGDEKGLKKYAFLFCRVPDSIC